MAIILRVFWGFGFVNTDVKYNILSNKSLLKWMFSVLSADGNTQLVAVWLRTLSSEAVKIEFISYQSIKEGQVIASY